MMTSIQFLRLLKEEFAEVFPNDSQRPAKSAMEALELIEIFKKQIQDETIKEFIKKYDSLYDSWRAKQCYPGEVEDSKNTLVK